MRPQNVSKLGKKEKDIAVKMQKIARALAALERKFDSLDREERRALRALRKKYDRIRNPHLKARERLRTEVKKMQAKCPRGPHSPYGEKNERCSVCLFWTTKPWDDTDRAHY